ncbi:MAG: response regulator [Oscillospiraceae bacterium]|nr:response regulator [Oscillospiraceae bacterium]
MENKLYTVLIADDSLTTLKICKNILSESYVVHTVQSAEKMFELLGRLSPDLILLDIEMPTTDGYAAIKKLKSSVATSKIPVVFFTAQSTNNGSELEGLELGAEDYIFKPFSPALFKQRIGNHIKWAHEREQRTRFGELLAEQAAELAELSALVQSDDKAASITRSLTERTVLIRDELN